MKIRKNLYFDSEFVRWIQDESEKDERSFTDEIVYLCKQALTYQLPKGKKEESK